MTLVPVLFQKLVALHGVDAGALSAELDGPVRTRTWPGAGASRREIASLPDRFPRFKGEAVGGVLLIQAMRLTERDTFSATARITRLQIPLPDLPVSVIAAMEGRRLAEIVGHPAVDAVTTVTRVRETSTPDNEPVLALDLDMHRVPLNGAGVRPARGGSAGPPDIAAIIALTHAAVRGAPRLPAETLTDPRRWTAGMGGDWTLVGLAGEMSAADGDHVIAVRFPYDRRIASAMGRAGAGAWFDRSSYSWRVAPTPEAVAMLSSFLARHADVVVGPDGALHLRHGN